jgi:hypothetical protein
MNRRSWVPFASLLTIAFSACIENPDQGTGDRVEQTGESSEAIRGAGINNTYLVTMARQPTGAEIIYWNSVQDFQVNDVIRFHAQWLQSAAGTADRAGVINRVYAAAYLRSPNSCEFDYWNNFIITTTTLPTYRDLARYLANYAQSNFYPIMGTFTYWDYGSAVGFYTNVRNTYSVPGC